MRIVFMGTPAFAAGILQALAADHEVLAVYTRPDAASGRGGRLRPSAVKQLAVRNGIPVAERKSLRDADDQRALAALAPDVVCVAAYGAILPPEVLRIPALGCLNVHASLLPRWRGAAPVERAILAGDEQTGVSIMRMEEGLDTGPYCLQRSTPIGTKNSAELACELSELGAEALLEALGHLEAGDIEWREQDEAAVTYAQKVTKADVALAPSDLAAEFVRKVAASGESRPARATVAGRSVAVVRAAVPEAGACDGVCAIHPGEVRLVRKQLLVGCADGPAQIVQVKPDGKKLMDAASFAAGIHGLKQEGARWGGAELEG